MNTLKADAPILKVGSSKVLFLEKELEFGFPSWQLEEILKLWKNGKSINYISKWTKRNPHEVFLALYEFWMDGIVDDIEKAFSTGPKLLIPGKQKLGGD